jgi:hypothetical protein
MYRVPCTAVFGRTQASPVNLEHSLAAPGRYPGNRLFWKVAIESRQIRICRQLELECILSVC